MSGDNILIVDVDKTSTEGLRELLRTELHVGTRHIALINSRGCSVEEIDLLHRRASLAALDAHFVDGVSIARPKIDMEAMKLVITNDMLAHEYIPEAKNKTHPFAKFFQKKTRW